MQTTMNRWGGVFVLATFILGLAKPLAETEAPAKPEADAPTAEAKQAALFKQFEKTLTNAEMTGQFTLVGKEVPPIKESYTIHSVKKMSQGDYWVFTARIKYGKKDITLPMPLQVKWAGNKPVIYLDNVTIPGLGTFSSYTVIDGDKYAGTWQHGDVGGHMFGTITPPSPKHLPQKRSNLEDRLVWLSCRPWVETQVSRIFTDQCGSSKLSLLLALLKDVRPRWGSACPFVLHRD